MTLILERIAADPNLMAAAVFGGSLLAVGMIVLLWTALFQKNERRMQKRLARVTRAPGQASQNEIELPVTESLRRRQKDSSFRQLDKLLKRSLPNIAMMRLRLERSGLKLAVGDYLLICLGLAVGSGVALGWGYGLGWMLALPAAIAIGVGLPHFYVGRRIAKRTKRFISLLPEALDLIVRGIRSGLPASEAINTIGREIDAPVGTEFQNVADQVKIGVNLDEALWATAKRLQIPEFNFLVISLAIQQETGGNLAEILEKLSDMVRRREQMRLKIKAMSSEARASAMIIGSLPFIMGTIIYLINPEYIGKLFTDPRGWVMIGIGLTSLSLGLGVMAKMVRFEI
ncbi:MAG: type II secretion system F family protein [Geminicoccaceae bacterium]|nr:type II secretion system F family protein [Geminicoccaceae bacterium]